MILVYSEGIVGVWAVKYTNGYKDTYTIKNDGTVMVKNKGRTTKLDPSDNEQIFPSAQGWFKTDRVHRQNTWEYVQVKALSIADAILSFLYTIAN